MACVLRVHVPPSTTLIVEGPSHVRLVEGACNVFGALIGTVEVEPFVSLPVTSGTGCVLEVDGGAIRAVPGTTIPGSWNAVPLRGTVLIVGPTDSGKTGLATYTLNRAVQRGLNVCVVDADIGQSDIGPPGTVAYACSAAPVPLLRYMSMEDGHFVGSTTPSGHEDASLAGITRMVRRASARYPHLIIVNMPGWVTDRGIRFTRSVVDAVEPDAVVVVGRKPALKGSLHVERPPHVRARTRDERAAIRRARYSRYLSGARRVAVDVEVLRGRPLFECPRRGDGWLVDCGTAIYEVYRGREYVREGDLLRVPLGHLHGLFVGLYRGGRLVGFGRLVDIDLEGGRVHLDATASSFDVAVAGTIRLGEGLEELEPLKA